MTVVASRANLILDVADTVTLHELDRNAITSTQFCTAIWISAWGSNWSPDNLILSSRGSRVAIIVEDITITSGTVKFELWADTSSGMTDPVLVGGGISLLQKGQHDLGLDVYPLLQLIAERPDAEELHLAAKIVISGTASVRFGAFLSNPL